MPDCIGLYYPHFTFPSDAWMKLAALYWDKLGRIVPPTYTPSDSDTVQRLQGELGFTKDFMPLYREKQEVCEMFSNLLQQYGDQLRAHYRVLQETSDLAYVYSDPKMTKTLADLLLRRGLAVHLPSYGSYGGLFTVIGMHPKLAFVYVEALASTMASHQQLHAVTDNVQDHAIVGDYTLERVAQALLEEDVKPHLVGNTPTDGEVAKQMAAIALRSILPKDIASTPVEKIIQLRQKHRTELTVFQTYIQEFTAKLDKIQQIDDPRALQAYLEAAYERGIKPQLEDLRKCMKSLAIETVMGVLNIKVALPPLLASADAALHLAPVPPEIAGVAAVACSVFPVYQKKRSEIYERVHVSPAAYLLYAEEGLTPTNVVSQVGRATRHLLLGV